MKVLFVLNPASGKSNNDKAILYIHEKAVSKPFDFKFLYTTGKDDDKRIQDDLAMFKPDRVIAGGGDGTVQLVARNLLNSKIPLGIIPLGSANGFATALNVPQNHLNAIDQAIDTNHAIPLDLLCFNGKHLSVHLGDLGLNAHMVRHYENDEQKGMLGYAKHLLRSIKETPLQRYSIKTPEGVFEREGYMLAFANAHKYGTGVHISNGEVWDGKFEIVNVPSVTLNEAIKAGLTALNVFVDKNMFSDVISCAKAEVTIDQPIDFQIDGEYMGEVDRLQVEIIPSAVRLLMP